MEDDDKFQEALKTAYGKRPDLRTAYRANAAGGVGAGARLGTAAAMRSMTGAGGRGLTARGKTARGTTAARLTTGYAAEVG